MATAKQELTDGQFGDVLGLAASMQLTKQAQVQYIQNPLKQVERRCGRGSYLAAERPGIR